MEPIPPSPDALRSVSSSVSRSIRFVYEIVRAEDNMLLAEGETLHLVTDREKKVRKVPEIYREKLLGDPIAPADTFPADEAPH